MSLSLRGMIHIQGTKLVHEFLLKLHKVDPLVSYSSTLCKSGKKFLSGAFRPYPEGGTGSGVFNLFQNLLVPDYYPG